MIEYDQSRDSKLKVFKKWNDTGLLQGIKNDFDKIQVANLLENQRLMNDFVIKNHKDKDKDKTRLHYFCRTSIPLARRVFSPNRFLAYKLASVQTLMNPAGIVYYRNRFGQIVGEEAGAKTTLLKTKLPFWETNKDVSSEGFVNFNGSVFLKEEYAERFPDFQYSAKGNLESDAQLTVRLSNSLSNELNHQVVRDLKNVANVNVEHDWVNPDRLGDAILAVSNLVGKNVGLPANWIVTTSAIANELSQAFAFQESEDKPEEFVDFHYKGKLAHKWDVYVCDNPDFDQDEILMGFKGDELHSGYIFIPYIPFSEGNVTYEEGQDFGYRPLVFRHGKKLIEGGGNFYATIKLNGYYIEEDWVPEIEPSDVKIAPNQDDMALWAEMAQVADRKTVVMAEGKQKTLDSEMFFGRPLLGKIVVLPRSDAKMFSVDRPWACVSISDTAEEHPIHITENNRVDILSLMFDDIEWEKDDFQMLDEYQAKSIWAFVEKVWNDVEILMIHCNAGISRSPAVAKAISAKYQPEFAEYFDQLYSPNKLVLEKLNKEVADDAE